MHDRLAFLLGWLVTQNALWLVLRDHLLGALFLHGRASIHADLVLEDPVPQVHQLAVTLPGVFCQVDVGIKGLLRKEAIWHAPQPIPFQTQDLQVGQLGQQVRGQCLQEVL